MKDNVREKAERRARKSCEERVNRHTRVSTPAPDVRSVLEDFHGSRYHVTASVVFHRVGLLGRTMGVKRIFLIKKTF